MVRCYIAETAGCGAMQPRHMMRSPHPQKPKKDDPPRKIILLDGDKQSNRFAKSYREVNFSITLFSQALSPDV
jgi:hypothetical protein